MTAASGGVSLAAPRVARRATLYEIIGVGWLVYWLTNSYIWMADLAPQLSFYVITALFLMYFSVVRPQQVLRFVLRPGVWFWSLTAIVPIVMYLTESRPSGYAYVAMRERIVYFGLVAGSGLVMADPDGPRMLRRAAGIALAVAIVVNFGEYFVHNPYNRTPGAVRSAGFYADANVAGAAIGTLLLLRLPITRQSTRSLLVVSLAYLAILATLSRSGMLFATVLAAAYLFVPRGPDTLRFGTRLTLGLGGFAVVLLGGVAAFLFFGLDTAETWRLRSAFTLDVSDSSAQGRMELASFALQRALEHFWTGRGLGTAMEYGVYAHNTYLTLLYEYGVLGLFAFLFVIGTGLFKVLRYGHARAATYLWLALQTAYYSNFDHTIATNPVFAVMFASFLTNASLEAPAPARSPSERAVAQR